MAHYFEGALAEKKSVSTVALSPTWFELGNRRSLARFAAKDIEVETGRVRSYPGLAGPAPRTELYYRAFSPYVAGKRVVDLGCGSGASLVLFKEASRVVGVDSDEATIEFARNSVPGIVFECRDAETDLSLEADVVTIVDLLGSVREPRLVLEQARELLSVSGRLCIAEPRAQAAQGLLSPVRRAFSKHELSCFLEETGFSIVEWVSEGSFLVAVAEKNESRAADWFMIGHHFARNGVFEGAIEAFDRITIEERLFTAAQLEVADCFYRIGELELGLGRLLAAQSKSERDPRVLSALSRASEMLGEKEDARKFAEAALAVDAGARVVALAHAKSLDEEISIGVRLAAWMNAARLAPDCVETAVTLARIATESEVYQLGVSSLERLRFNHASLTADYNLPNGWLYLMVDRVEDALMESRIVALAEPSHPGLGELVSGVCAAGPRYAGAC